MSTATAPAVDTKKKSYDDVKEARKANRLAIKLGAADSKARARKAGKDQPILSTKAVGFILRLVDTLDATTAKEVNEALAELGVDEASIMEVRELMKDPTAFQNAGKPDKLDVLQLPPGAQKPREFSAPPGKEDTLEIDERYWPTRYTVVPLEEDLESGDLVYCVQEDKSFIVLNEVQQTPEWQAANHMPPMNFLFRVGGSTKEEAKAEKTSEETKKAANAALGKN